MSTAPAKPRYTDEQRLAIRTRDVSVSLSSGAGCGKTFVLTERYLAYFDPHDPQHLKPADIARLVAITFTERAAREMRDRVRRACYQRLQSEGPADSPHWADMLRALDHARISTIHSFCASLLRFRAVEAELDPEFAMLEPPQAETLLTEAIDDELRRRLSDRDDAALDVLSNFHLLLARDMVRELVNNCTAEDYARWSEMSPQQQVELWLRERDRMLGQIGLRLLETESARAMREILAGPLPDHANMRAKRAALESAFAQLEAGIQNAPQFGAVLADLKEHSRVQDVGRKLWPDPAAYEAFRDACKDIREKRVPALENVAAFDPQQALVAAVLGRQFLAVAAASAQRYARRKLELRVLDFNDLLVRARQLLCSDAGDELRRQLSSQIDLLLVDEFQDTDPVQVELIKALLGEGLGAGKLFFVGDYKQSIYRFRGADPRVFHQLRSETPPGGKQILSLNFRSQPAILDFVNALFREDMGPDYEALVPHREQVGPQPAIEFLWAPAPPGQAKNVDQMRRREADWIAARIAQLLADPTPQVWDAKSNTLRRAQPGDIAILFRALSDVEAYEAALRDQGIDYYLVGGHAFYAQQEIFDLVNLLRTLVSPIDEISLIGALRSGFFSLADEALYWLAQHPGGIAAGLAAKAPPAELDESQRRRVLFARDTIANLRDCKDCLPISELIERALELTGYDAALLGEFLGERKLANLHKLIEQARSFERGGFFGLPDFIAQLSEFVARQPDEPLAATHSEETDVVRLMTVHQAKGLEFPIVLVPDLNRKPGGSSLGMHFDSRLGPLVRPPKNDDNERAVSGFDLWQQREKDEEAAETKRLLYVATTRAADRLILSSGVKTVGAAESPWMKLLERRFDLTNGDFLGKVVPDSRAPRVHASCERPDVAPAAHRRSGREVERLVAQLSELAPAKLALAQAVEPVPPQLAARTRFSFSRLKGGTLYRGAERFEETLARDTSALDSLGLGTLVHAALAVVDFAAPGNWRNIVERLAEQHLPGRPREAAEAATLIERFLASPRAKEVAAARQSHREVEFLLAWPPGGDAPRRVQLRGFIDCLYQDQAGGWHILDFKTNQVDANTLPGVAATYEMQMLVYALAAERVLKVPPTRLVLHFLRTGGEHAFAWDETARRRVVDLVNQGIAQAVQS